MRITLIIIFFIIFNNSFGQDAKEKVKNPYSPFIWANIGPNLLQSFDNLGYKIDLDVLIMNSLYTASYYDNFEFEFLKPCLEGRHYYSIMAGRSWRKNYLTRSISMGPAIVNIIYCDSIGSTGGFFNWTIYKQRPEFFGGISLKAQTIVHYKFIGIGLSIDANLNKIKSFFGGGINLSLGWL